MSPVTASLLEAFQKAEKAILPIRKKKAVRDHKEVIRALKPFMAKAAREWLAVVRSAVDPSKLKGGDVDAAIEGLADWGAVEEAGKKIYGKVVLQGIQAAGLKFSPGQRARILKDRTDPIGEAAVRWARKNTARLVTEVTKTTKESIKGVVVRSLKDGRNLQDTQKLIKPMIGLRTDQSNAALNVYEKALDSGLSEAEAIEDMADYSRRALADRAELIAQTESAMASSAGLLAAYEENDIQEAQWAADLGPGCCDECTALDGQSFSIEDADGMLPAHPGCECSWIYSSRKE